ncbi:hypothetical protein [Streptomyces sp. NRRL B-24572]|uniref:hypothetical protein n=1 Tax=Streptomyces sp. NRRL B-24572 TaxID=1962156 RepID=UPI0015C4FB0B|nr:hypothetical protein [Streptomyces sp. NRRL B-24572]
MTSREYREKAEKLLRNALFGGHPSPAAIEEAAVWARLAQAAATTEAAANAQTSEEK